MGTEGKQGIPSTPSEWADHWRRQYRRSLNLSQQDPLPSGQEEVIAFLRGLRDRGKAAWQRLQALRAIVDHLRDVQLIDVRHLQPLEDKLIQIADDEQRERKRKSPGNGEQSRPAR